VAINKNINVITLKFGFRPTPSNIVDMIKLLFCQLNCKSMIKTFKIIWYLKWSSLIFDL